MAGERKSIFLSPFDPNIRPLFTTEILNLLGTNDVGEFLPLSDRSY